MGIEENDTHSDETLRDEKSYDEMRSYDVAPRASTPGAVRCLATNGSGEKKLDRELRSSQIYERRSSADAMMSFRSRVSGDCPLGAPQQIKSSDNDEVLCDEKGIQSDDDDNDNDALSRCSRASTPGAVRCLATNKLGEKKLDRDMRNSLINERRRSSAMTDCRVVDKNRYSPNQQGPSGSELESLRGDETMDDATQQPGAIPSNSPKRLLGEKKSGREQRNGESTGGGGGRSPNAKMGLKGSGKEEPTANDAEHHDDDEEEGATVGQNAPASHSNRNSRTSQWAWVAELPSSQFRNSNAHSESERVSVKRQTVAKIQCMVGCVFFLLLIIVAVVVGVVVAGRGGNGNKETPNGLETNPTMPPDATGVDPTLIPNILDSTVVKLMDKTSPQCKAHSWIVQDPIFGQYEDWQTTQRFVLATFYHTMGGPRWGDDSSWLDCEVNECEWMNGDNICHEDMTIKLINTTKQRGFKGSMPIELTLLTNLEGLDFSNNTLGGDLAGLFGNHFNYHSLQVFRCSECRLVGTTPVEFPQMTNLVSIALNNNETTGELPPNMGQLQQLRALELEGNQLSGAIPTTIGAIENLEVLKLRFNQLRSVPSDIGKLSELVHLDVGNNHITQTIPTELGALEKLQGLELDQNAFHGTMPSELYGLTNLVRLLLNGNELSGSIQEEIYSLSNLRWLWMGLNDIGGPIPSSIGLMTSLTKLDVGQNILTSTMPSELGLLLELKELRLDRNDLSGSIPSEIAGIHHLTTFDLTGNPSIVQQLPEDFCPSPSAKLKTDWCSGGACCT